MQRTAMHKNAQKCNQCMHPDKHYHIVHACFEQHNCTRAPLRSQCTALHCQGTDVRAFSCSVLLIPSTSATTPASVATLSVNAVVSATLPPKPRSHCAAAAGIDDDESDALSVTSAPLSGASISSNTSIVSCASSTATAPTVWSRAPTSTRDPVPGDKGLLLAPGRPNPLERSFDRPCQVPECPMAQPNATPQRDARYIVCQCQQNTAVQCLGLWPRGTPRSCILCVRSQLATEKRKPNCPRLSAQRISTRNCSYSSCMHRRRTNGYIRARARNSHGTATVQTGIEAATIAAALDRQQREQQQQQYITA